MGGIECPLQGDPADTPRVVLNDLDGARRLVRRFAIDAGGQCAYLVILQASAVRDARDVPWYFRAATIRWRDARRNGTAFDPLPGLDVDLG
jgi:hypothetical protein